MSARFPCILPHGLDGILVRFADRLTAPANRAALAFRAALEEAGLPGVAETAPALASVYLRFDPDAVAAAELEAALDAMLARCDWFAAGPPAAARRWTIPAVFGGAAAPGLAAAAEQAGMSEADAVAALTAAPVTVMAIGFAPGQPYLGQLPEVWDLPRLERLAEVPAAALVLAIRQLVLFANPSPTGWRHVAQTGFRCFRPERRDPFPLRPGDAVQVRAVPEHALAGLAEDPEGGATCEAGA